MKTCSSRISLIVLIPLALAISGCGIGTQSTSAGLSSAEVQGTIFGGRTPISSAVVSIYTVGNTGYGSAATQVGSSVTTNGGGGFAFPNGTLSACAAATPNAPIYMLSVGGNAGGGSTNSYAVLGASLGTCGNFAPNININEITTTALAFAMSHFFSATSGDTFGGPNATSGTYAPYAFGLGLAAAHTIPAIVNTASGLTTANSSLVTLDAAKIYSIGNSLAACVNSVAPAYSACGTLFSNTTPPGSSTAPTDTLQAAVNMALYPYQNVSTIYKIASATGAPYVGLSSAPNDWTIGVSYKSAAFGLALNAQTLTTIDIDSNGKVWFPSNATGAVGVGNFDPSAEAFNGPYTATGLVHPQQLAIDNTGTVWVDDNASSGIYGFIASSGSATPYIFTLANTVSTAIAIDDNNNVDVAVKNTSSGTYYIAIENSGTYAEFGTKTTSTYIQSIAADVDGGEAISLINMSGSTASGDYIEGTGPTYLNVIAAVSDNAGQVAFTGANYVFALPQSGPTLTHDSLCVYVSQACFPVTSTQALSPYGVAVDGDGTLWLADAANTLNSDSSTNTAYAGAQAILPTSSGYANSSKTVVNNAYFHGTGNGATATMPYGIAIDGSGNVWLSNVGCIITAPATSCTPGSFVLTELIGAAAPTFTPVSAAVVGSNDGPGTRP